MHSENNIQSGEPKCWWKDNIEKDNMGIKFVGLNFIYVNWDRVYWYAFVNTVMAVHLPYKAVNTIS